MKHKQLAILALALVLSLALGAVAYGEGEKPAIGVIDIAGAEDITEQMFPGQFGKVLLFPTMNEVLLALKSGRVQQAMVTEDNALFLMEADDTYQYERTALPTAPLTMLTRSSDSELTEALNAALTTLKENGTLEALHAEYIDGVSPDNLPAAPQAEQIAGAREVIVGVSGDYPPHDYISVTGDPAGFNVALMTEIAKLAGINIKYEPVAFGSKFAALESSRIDLFFLHAGYTSFEGIAQTEAYDEGVYVGLLSLK